jgi:hypothetical protein
MIDSATCETAIQAAQDALSDESTNLSWVRSSNLIRRAYFLGLIIGLDAISEKDVISANLKTVMGTFWETSGDDTFKSTETGRQYRDLMELIRRTIEHQDHLNRLALEGVDYGASRSEMNNTTKSIIEKLDENINTIQLANEKFIHIIGDHKSRLSEIRRSMLKQINEQTEDVYSLKIWEDIHIEMTHLEDTARIIALLETDHKWATRLR